MESRLTKRAMIIVGVLLGLMLAAIVTLSVFVAMLAEDRAFVSRDMENRYQSAYYGLMTSMVDIENDLAKAKVMTGSGILEDTLEKIDVNSQLANVYLSVLTTSENNMANLNKFLNQLSGYANFVMNNMARNKGVSEEDRAVFDEMWRVSKEYGRILADVQDELNNGYSFVKSLGKADDKFSNLFINIDGSAIEYPTLIYDGPFSDGVADREPKGLSGREYSEAEARDMLAKYLVGYNIENINGVIENDYRIPSYIYSVVLAGGRDCSVQISKKGGMLLMMDLYHEVMSPELTVEQCRVVAEQYCESIGLDNMTAVWLNVNNSNVYINMCYEQDGVILYPDMVKLKVSMDTGEVIGFEGLNYAFNHTARDEGHLRAEVSAEEVVLNVSSLLTGVETRLCMIPVDVVNELLCYEVVGKVGEEEYFIYIDAATGDEVRVLRMIDSNQGELLM